MKVSFLKRTETELPEIKEVSLLTYEEFENFNEIIKAPLISSLDAEADVWYLRDNGDIEFDANGQDVTDSDVLITVEDGDVVKTAPDEFDDYVFQYREFCGYGVRPALYFAGSLTEAGLVPGDRFEIDDYSFSVISDKIALCDFLLDFCVFDENSDNGNPSPNYENSEIKEIVDDWGQQFLNR